METLDEFLRKIISEVNTETDIHAVAKTIKDNLVSKYGFYNSEKLEEKMYMLLLGYRNNNIDSDTFIRMAKIDQAVGITSSQNNTAVKSSESRSNSGGFKSSNPKDNKTETTKKDETSSVNENAAAKQESSPEKTTTTSSSSTTSQPSETNAPPVAVIDIDTEFINEVSSNYNSVEENVKSTTIDISQEEIIQEASSLLEMLENSKNGIQEELDNVKNVMIESLTSVEYIDNEIDDLDFNSFDFNDIWNFSGNIIATGVKVADEAFFEQCGYTVEKDIVRVDEYTYNIRTHKLVANGVETEAIIYIPMGLSDYSKANTVTIFDNVNTGYKSANSILISLGEKDGLRLQQVTNATKFVNKVANTDLSKCQNIITGGSRFGARSLKYAADAGDLYQTIICVNQGVIVKGVNGAGQGKEAFENIEQLKKLNGKNIYIVASKDEPSLTMRYGHGSEYDRCNDVTKCYVYTGLKLLIEHCPDSQIYFISNNENPAFKELEGANYHYGYDLWNEIANGDYKEHRDLHNIISDLCSSNLIGYNGYNAQA